MINVTEILHGVTWNEIIWSNQQKKNHVWTTGRKQVR